MPALLYGIPTSRLCGYGSGIERIVSIVTETLAIGMSDTTKVLARPLNPLHRPSITILTI
jgi:hypothetical protein